MRLTLLAVLTLVMLHWFPMRLRMSRRGAAPSDLAGVMAGDALLVTPAYSGTMAVTVEARPEHIWPWLVQIGYRRGGRYTRTEAMGGSAVTWRPADAHRW